MFNLFNKTEDGAVYKGEKKDGKPHGKGKKTWKDGSYYEGDFVNGIQCGNGKYTWVYGVFEGHFAEDKPVKGKITSNDGTVYEGETAKVQWNIVANGKGKRTSPDGSIQEGYFYYGGYVAKTLETYKKIKIKRDEENRKAAEEYEARGGTFYMPDSPYI